MAHNLVIAKGDFGQVFTPSACAFLESLVLNFGKPLEALLHQRNLRQKALDKGALPDFLSETKSIRDGDWKIAPLPAILSERKVEITGPCDRKMMINALNSGASVFMADLEDATSPTWQNIVGAQINLFDAVRGTISFQEGPAQKKYTLKPETATLMVRPRGLHLLEKHILLATKPVPACLVDFGLFFFHNASLLASQKKGPFFYLPKLQNHLEARWWNDVLSFAEQQLGIEQGTTKVTVLIETLLAAFEMDEILFELKDHAAGLNCGRWDYIFSYIKAFRAYPNRILPDRYQVAMTQPMMRAYTQLLVKTCHRRGAHAIGGMAAQIPVKGDAALNNIAIQKVQADKLREVRDGHDGTWVAHPALVPVARAIFDHYQVGDNQLQILRSEFKTTKDELIETPKGFVTLEGVSQNIRICLHYLSAWFNGLGCVPINYLMEDAATAEIARSQLWQWVHHKVKIETGEVITPALFLSLLQMEVDVLSKSKSYSIRAEQLLRELTLSAELEDFLTLPAYEILLGDNHDDIRENLHTESIQRPAF